MPLKSTSLSGSNSTSTLGRQSFSPCVPPEALSLKSSTTHRLYRTSSFRHTSQPGVSSKAPPLKLHMNSHSNKILRYRDLTCFQSTAKSASHAWNTPCPEFINTIKSSDQITGAGCWLTGILSWSTSMINVFPLLAVVGPCRHGKTQGHFMMCHRMASVIQLYEEPWVCWFQCTAKCSAVQSRSV